VNNLKQLYLGASGYSGDNNVLRVAAGKIGPFASRNSNPLIGKYEDWHIQLLAGKYIPAGKTFRESAIDQTTTPKILTCPSYNGKRGWGYNRATDYGMNDSFRGYYTDKPKLKWLPNTVIKHPERTVYFGERTGGSLSCAEDWLKFISQRHKRNANFVFLSGNVKSLIHHQIPYWVSGAGTYSQAPYTYFWRNGESGPYDWKI
jgi:hypothetical protein